MKSIADILAIVFMIVALVYICMGRIDLATYNAVMAVLMRTYSIEKE